MAQVYLSGPIIHENLRRDDFYKSVIKHLENREIDVFAPQFMAASDAKHIYERDVEHVRKSDLLIAEVSNPSLGVGMEIMLAIELGKPVLMFRHRESERLSRMAFGAAGKVLFEYSTLDEVEDILAQIRLKELNVHECAQCDSHVAETQAGIHRCVFCGSTD
jgi:nucleoside 2-deoxyribosyltransferase